MPPLKSQQPSGHCQFAERDQSVENEIAGLRDKVQRLEKANSQHDWPKLDSEKSKRLTTVLSHIEPRLLYIACNEDDCRALAEEIRDAAKHAGWDARVLAGASAGTASGVVLSASGPDRNPSAQLAKALEEAANYPVLLKFTPEKSPPGSTPFYFLTIGRRPRPEDVVVGQGPNPPTKGDFMEGDIWRNTAPKPGGNLGWIWVCDDNQNCAWNAYGGISL